MSVQFNPNSCGAVFEIVLKLGGLAPKVQKCVREAGTFSLLGAAFAGLSAAAAITAIVSVSLSLPVLAVVSTFAALYFGGASALMFAQEPKNGKEEQELPPPALSSSPEWTIEGSQTASEELTGTDLYALIKARTQPVRPLPFSPSSRGRFSDVECAAETACGIFPEELVFPGMSQEYIHANFISNGASNDAKPLAIAGQAPLPDQWSPFWEAIHTHNVRTIVDLTNQRDNIEPYAPSYGYPARNFFENILITVSSLESSEDEQWTRTSLALEHNGKTQFIERLHYKKWPDHGVVSVDELEQMVNFLADSQANAESPFFIHCRAGVGRTGVVLAALQPRLMESIPDPEKAVEETVLRLRRERSTGMVQNAEQMQLLLDYARRISVA